jgi:uncharacterized SAM-binding protein YcdF (DUF218 family)
MLDVAGAFLAGLIIAAGAAVLGRKRLAAALLVALGCVAALVSLSPLPALMLRPLEERFPRPSPIDGIVVIGGAGRSRGQVALYSSGARIVAGARLANLARAARLIYSGGSPSEGAEWTEADAAAELFAMFGVAPDRIT